MHVSAACHNNDTYKDTYTRFSYIYETTTIYMQTSPLISVAVMSLCSFTALPLFIYRHEFKPYGKEKKGLKLNI